LRRPIDLPLVSQLARQGAWSVGDHALVSAANFASTVLLARGLGPAEFGKFTLAYTVLILFGNLQAALLTQPHGVLGASRSGAEYQRYTSTTGTAQVLLAVGLTLVVLFGGAVFQVAIPGEEGRIWALAAAVIPWQLQEFARRVLYTERRLGQAFANDLLCYGTQVAGLILLGQLTSERALLIVAGSSLLGAGFGFWQLRASLTPSCDRRYLTANWLFGRWLCGSELAYWVGTQSIVYLTAAILGPAAAGVLRVAATVFGPLRILTSSLYRLLPIWFARSAWATGGSLRRGHLAVSYAATLPPAAAYCLAVALLAGTLLPLLFGEAYVGYGLVLALYSGYALAGYLAQPIRAALAATYRTPLIFAGNVIGCLPPLIVGWPLISLFGLTGAAVTLILSEATINIAFWKSYRDSQSAAPAT
jgi:O-antigen/teichoic acid export membrane protein